MDKYLLHINEKEKEVKKLFKPNLVKETIIMDKPENYRHKVVGTFAYNKNKIICGQYLPKTHKVEVVGRELQHPVANKILDSICLVANQMKYEPFNEKNGLGVLRHVMIRVGYNTNEVMVILVIADRDLPGKREFAKRLLKYHPEITTIIININMKDTTMVLGDRNNVVYGSGFIFDSIEDIKFKLSPSSFYQVNPAQMIKLYNKAIEMADFKSSDNVLDVFCGIGTLTLLIAKYVGNVVGIELNQEAINDAKGNALYNKVGNASFVCDDASKWLSRQNSKFDVVVLDPPRSGCGSLFISSLIKLNPEKIVYISCNPVTQKEDVDKLEKNGYKIVTIQPVDMFPFTSHVETIVLMSRAAPIK